MTYQFVALYFLSLQFIIRFVTDSRGRLSLQFSVIYVISNLQNQGVPENIYVFGVLAARSRVDAE